MARATTKPRKSENVNEEEDSGAFQSRKAGKTSRAAYGRRKLASRSTQTAGKNKTRTSTTGTRRRSLTGTSSQYGTGRGEEGYATYDEDGDQFKRGRRQTAGRRYSENPKDYQYASERREDPYGDYSTYRGWGESEGEYYEGPSGREEYSSRSTPQREQRYGSSLQYAGAQCPACGYQLGESSTNERNEYGYGGMQSERYGQDQPGGSRHERGSYSEMSEPAEEQYYRRYKGSYGNR
jgi:hypothetical protein